MLKDSFNKAKKGEKSAFLCSLKYALVREVSVSSIFDSYIASRAHKLACFAQSHDLVQTNKQANKQTDRTTYRQNDYSTPLLRTRKGK